MARHVLLHAVVRVWLAIVLSAAGSACVIDTLPMPEGRKSAGSPDGFYPDIDYTDSVYMGALFWSTGEPSLLVGVAQAAPPASRIAVNNPARSGWRGEIAVATNGSFNMPINAGPGDIVKIELIIGTTLLNQGTLMLDTASAAALAASQDLGEAGDPVAVHTFTVSPPDSQGRVNVSGNTYAGIAIVVANRTLGQSTVAYATTGGQFSALIAGRSGDSLALFVVEPASSNGGSTPKSTVVP